MAEALEDRLRELCQEIGRCHELSAHLTPDGVCVEVRGTQTAKRLYSLMAVSLCNVNILTLELDDMRAEAGGLTARESKP